MKTSCWTISAVSGLLAAIAVLSGCEAQIEEFAGPTQGSHYEIKYVPGEQTPPKAQVRREVEALLEQIDQQMSTWRADSDLSRFNQLPAGSCRIMPEPVLELIAKGDQLAQESGGAFDLTVEPLLNVWGFGPQSRSRHVPTAQQIAQARLLVGHQHLSRKGSELCKDVAAQIDLNSIAAGDTVDRIAQLLEQQGVSSYLINVTGELKGRGKKPDGSSWRIAIEAPDEDRQVAQKIIELDGLGVSTSGDYRNYYEENGQRFSHTLDPRQGRPISHKLAAVTVFDPSAMRADGLSTLLMVLGPDEGYEFAKAHQIAAFFVTRTAQGFSAQSTPVFVRLFGQGDQP